MTRNLPRNSNTLNALSYQADCAYKMPHNLDEAVSAIRVNVCLMFIRRSMCSARIANFLYEFGFLGSWMYGYATVSYNQILERLKFLPAHTVVTTALLKLKNIYVNEDELTFV